MDIHDGRHTDQETRRRRGPLGWLHDWIHRWLRPVDDDTVEPEPDRHEEHKLELAQQELRTPAKGDAFDFLVDVHLEWCGSDTGPEGLDTKAAARRATVLDSLTSTVRTIAREFPPHHAADAEQAVNDGLKAGWCFDDGKLTCAAQVRLAPEPRVREHQQEVWIRRLSAEAEADLAGRKLGAFEELLGRWRSVLEPLGDDKVAPYAAELVARPELAAGAVARLVAARDEDHERLIQEVRQAVTVHQGINVYEFVTSYDSALRVLAKRYNVELPGVDPDLDDANNGGYRGDDPGGVGAARER